MSISALSISTVEAFDRNRLMVDLDEATDPNSPPAVLLVVGLRQLGEIVAGNRSDETLARIRDVFAEIVGSVGTDYRTRGTELCAILDQPAKVERIVAALEQQLAALAGPEFRAACGAVELPAEAHDALEALLLVDKRVTAAYGPVTFD